MPNGTGLSFGKLNCRTENPFAFGIENLPKIMVFTNFTSFIFCLRGHFN